MALALVAACGDDRGSGSSADAAVSDPADARTEPASRVEQYIRGDVATRLILEIDSVAGFEPRSQVETDLLDGLATILDKPDGIDAVRDGAISSRGADHAWTFDELQALADEHNDLVLAGNAIAIHVMFVDGHSADDSDSGKVLGLAWANRHLVMFKQTIESLCAADGIPPLLRDRLCAGAELSIWTHEVGHVIGLVDNGLPMVADHRDADHGAHDLSEDCVMYWAYEGDAVIGKLRDRITGGGSDSLGFDDACLADIAAVRER